MTSIGSLLAAAGREPCPICHGDCVPTEDHVDRLKTDPFAPGGRDKVPGEEGKDFVVAPHAIHDPELERNVYGFGDRVPMADAIKYGLVDAPKAKARAKKPAEDRAKKPAENRSRRSR